MSVESLVPNADRAVVVCSLWLLTYMLHSSLLLGGAWLSTYVGRNRLGEPMKELIWKTAIVGGIITASIQASADMTPFGGRIELETMQRGDSGAVSSGVAVAPPHHESLATAGRAGAREGASATRAIVENEHGIRSVGTAVESAGPEAESSVDPESERRALSAGNVRHGPVWWSTTLSFLLLSVAVGGVILVVRTRRRLLNKLACRKSIGPGRLRAMLDSLCEEAGMGREVRLTWSSRIAVPMALGIFRGEICLPRRALTDLSAEQQEAMLAHELAHLIRHDPAWQALVHLIGCVFFFQPLNRGVLKRLREASEFNCDALSADLAGRPLALAQCLAEVAGWITAGRCRPAAAAAVEMAGEPSTLACRIERLLGNRPSGARKMGRTSSIVVTAFLLAAITIMVPSVTAVSLFPERDGLGGVGTENHGHDSRPETECQTLLDALGALDSEILALESEVIALKNSWPATGKKEILLDDALIERLGRELDRVRERRETLREQVERLSKDMENNRMNLERDR